MVENLWTYYTTGYYAVLETIMIMGFVVFLGWNVKLFMENQDEEIKEGD